MEKVFKKDYAYFYDIFYKNKNYIEECEFLEKIFKKFLKNSPHQILDVACGTGGHANNLAKKGYAVTGIDASEYMLKRAKEKAQKESLKIKYFKMQMESFNLNHKFDAIISMFSTINYLTDYKTLEKFLKNVHKHLKKDSLFIFDFWNGVAVLKYYTPFKKKTYTDKNLTIDRESKTEVYPKDNLCIVNYTISVRDKINLTKKVFKERHLIRYFFIPELKFILEKCGFQTLGTFPFLNLNKQIKPFDWDVTFVAKRLR